MKSNKHPSNKNRASSPLTVLVVEDDEDLNRLIQINLQKSGFHAEGVLNGSDAIARIVEDPNKLLLLDYMLPDMTGEEVIRSLTDRAMSVPFIIITGHGDEKIAVEMMKLGARDCIVKKPDYFDSLPQVVKRVLNELVTERKLAKAEESLKASEERWHSLVENSPDTIMTVTSDGTITFINHTLSGLTPEQTVGTKIYDYIPAIHHETVRKSLARVFETGENVNYEIYEIGSPCTASWYANRFAPVKREGKVVGATLITTDITERKQAEEALKSSEQKFRDMGELLPETIFECDVEGNISFANKIAFEKFGYSQEDFIKGVNSIQMIVPDDRERAMKNVSMILEGELIGATEYTALRKDGSSFPVIIYSSPIIHEDECVGLRGIIIDITERVNLEKQFLQAQKMEGIGRLAGGVAHDFNNLLTVISGHTELASASLDSRDPLQDNLKEILNAASRAADLTRQLLAFSRRQTLQPKILSLNDVITELDKMMRRIIGEDIDLVTIPKRDLWRVRTDPGQMEQVIINLAVNARDAMPTGGKLTIETQNVELDKEYANAHADVTPGSYVMLAISDTGCGMTEEVKAQIFDPFFTTKKEGEGTGLGLSTVYGIVKQSGGNIWVYSELDSGTTFKVYLPMVAEEAEKLSLREDVFEMPRGTETVLVVEDEDSVRMLACLILKQQGYSVLEADSADKALLICKEIKGQIDLVVTDVIMPKTSGAELVNKLREIRSDFKVLYMSGYTANAIVHSGILETDISYLQKPFRPVDIALKVRRVLDGA